MTLPKQEHLIPRPTCPPTAPTNPPKTCTIHIKISPTSKLPDLKSLPHLVRPPGPPLPAMPTASTAKWRCWIISAAGVKKFKGLIGAAIVPSPPKSLYPSLRAIRVLLGVESTVCREDRWICKGKCRFSSLAILNSHPFLTARANNCKCRCLRWIKRWWAICTKIPEKRMKMPFLMMLRKGQWIPCLKTALATSRNCRTSNN